MASKISNKALLRALTDYLITDKDIRALLVMTSTTVDTEIAAASIEFIDDFTTLDEFDGENYVRKTLVDPAVTASDTYNRAEYSANDLLWTSLGAGTRPIQGILIYDHVTDDTDSEPVVFIQFASTVTADGSNFQIDWTGILRASQGA